MKTVSKIIESHGGLEWLCKPGNYIRLENPPYMRLVIEYIGEGPRRLPSISVAHYYEQNGDAMRDPEIVFEIDEDGAWCPVSYLQDNLGIYQEAVNLDGEVRINPKLVNELSSFARQWDKNIADQGFLALCKTKTLAIPTSVAGVQVVKSISNAKFRQAYSDIRNAAAEGVVLKRRDSHYLKQAGPGIESREWFKRRILWD